MGPSPCDSCDGGGDTDLVRGVCVGSAVDVTFGMCDVAAHDERSVLVPPSHPVWGGREQLLVGVIPVV